MVERDGEWFGVEVWRKWELSTGKVGAKDRAAVKTQEPRDAVRGHKSQRATREEFKACVRGKAHLSPRFNFQCHHRKHCYLSRQVRVITQTFELFVPSSSLPSQATSPSFFSALRFLRCKSPAPSCHLREMAKLPRNGSSSGNHYHRRTQPPFRNPLPKYKAA